MFRPWTVPEDIRECLCLHVPDGSAHQVGDHNRHGRRYGRIYPQVLIPPYMQEVCDSTAKSRDSIQKVDKTLQRVRNMLLKAEKKLRTIWSMFQMVASKTKSIRGFNRNFQQGSTWLFFLFFFLLFLDYFNGEIDTYCLLLKGLLLRLLDHVINIVIYSISHSCTLFNF